MINKITVSEFINGNSTDTVNYAYKYSIDFKLPIDHFNVGDLKKISFGKIKDLQSNFTKQNIELKQLIEIISEFTGISIDEIYKISLLKYTQAPYSMVVPL